jgi:FkbM family methyltransferase
VRGGLHPGSALKIALGRHDDVRLRGVRLSGPDARGVANTAVEVAAGEYAAAGFGIERGDRVLDGGANVGAFAVLAARAGGLVVAYEPHPETFRHLERNTAGLEVRCVQAALVAEANEPTAALAVGSRADTHHRVGAGDETVDVPAVALTEAIGDGCDLLKLDVEGSEFELLTGTRTDVLARARRIACEVHPWAGEPAALCERLEAAGHRVEVRSKRDGLALIFARRV